MNPSGNQEKDKNICFKTNRFPTNCNEFWKIIIIIFFIKESKTGAELIQDIIILDALRIEPHVDLKITKNPTASKDPSLRIISDYFGII